MKIESLATASLKEASYNPRRALQPGDCEYEALRRSLEQFGYVEPVIVNKTTGNIVGGHQRFSVLKSLGKTHIDCVVVELDEQKEKALNIALNKIQGEWDTDKLSSLLTELDEQDFDISLTGFEASEVEELLDSFYSKEAIQDDFDSEKVHEEIKAKGTSIKQGDIYKLGEHKLMCGTATSGQDLAKLLNGNKAQLTFTTLEKISVKDYEQNGMDKWKENLAKAVANITKATHLACVSLQDFSATKTQYIEPTNSYVTDSFCQNGLRPIWIRVWKKQGKNIGTSGYHLSTNKPIPQYEYISAYGNEQQEYNDQEYTWLSAFASHSYKFVKRLNKDERKKWGYSGVWDMSANGNDIPVELPWRCIKMHSDKGDIILDPYGKNGTTVIACEQLDRACYCLESDPHYVQLIIDRWEEFTGQKAVKVC